MTRSADRHSGAHLTAAPSGAGERGPRVRGCTLDRFAEVVARTDGIALSDLPPITALRVQTANTLYDITVPRPSCTTVLVRGGRFFPRATEARFGGSSFGGSCLKLDWFGVGLHMEFHYDGGWVVTSPIRSLTVLGASSLPGPF